VREARLNEPVLAVDIDGVLNTLDVHPARTGGTGLGDRPVFLPGPMRALNRAVATTSCKVIISSTWRTRFALRGLTRLMVDGGFEHGPAVIGKTPDLSRQEKGPLWRAATRGAEICAWRAEVGHTGHLAIADDNYDMDGVREHLVLVNPFVGLTDDDADMLISLLRGEAP
jgi:hypothetical protein